MNGAGGDGGSITILSGADPSARRAMIRAIARDNPAWASIPIAISRKGLRVWCTEAETPGARKFG